MESKTGKELHMGEAYYGKEPFDLRLTVLLLMRKIPQILAITIVGTLLFGGIYCVKNLLLTGGPFYEVSSTYKVSFTEEPSKAGDYYINEMTWGTYVHSDEFLNAVWEHLAEEAKLSDSELAASSEELEPYITAKLASDVHVPTTIVSTTSESFSAALADAVELAMTEEFVQGNEQILSMKVIDRATGEKARMTDLQPRPARAFVLGAVLSGFFAVIYFLLKELGDDSIWLPATLRARYGLNALGTVESAELAGNLEHVFADKSKIAVCAVSDECDPMEVIARLQEKCKKEWFAIPTPMLCSEAGEAMRGADGVLLVADAGRHTGKPLEYVLEYLRTQNVSITATLLWNADEALIRQYYLLPETCGKETNSL